MTLLDLDTAEDAILKEFKELEIFQKLTSLSDLDLQAILLQRRYLSYCFTTVYDFAIDAIVDISSKIILRKILREEYVDSSGCTTSHREDLFNDLTKLGIDRSIIISTAPTEETIKNIQNTLAYVIKISNELNSDLKVFSFLRFWGEILVSSEYEQYWKVLEEKFKAKNSKSSFYYVHYIHDMKKTSLQAISARATTHADKLSLNLITFIKRTNYEGIVDVTDVEIEAYKLRAKFYDQF